MVRSVLTSNCVFLVSTPISSFISDRVQKYKDSRRHALSISTSCPEDRLFGAIIACATLVPLSVLGLGPSTIYINGVPGLLLNFMCLFLNGVGVSPSALSGPEGI